MRQGTPFRTLLLDAEGVSAVATRHLTVRRYLAAAAAHSARVAAPWTVLAETLHGSGRRAREHAVSRLSLVELTADHYRDAARLMDRASLGGRTIDALVVAAARTCEKPVVIVTSDPGDIKALIRGEPGIAVVAV
ncbi:MAG: hypothetical protein Q8R60_12615 [Mycobacteriales bacterium]|nr:hypothetical protein [Mycobacteriales bacterium]